MKDCCPRAHILKYKIPQLTMMLTRESIGAVSQKDKLTTMKKNKHPKALVWKLERTLIKSYKQHVFIS